MIAAQPGDTNCCAGETPVRTTVRARVVSAALSLVYVALAGVMVFAADNPGILRGYSGCQSCGKLEGDYLGTLCGGFAHSMDGRRAN